MKYTSNIKRKIFPKTPKRSTSPGTPLSAGAGLPGLGPEQNAGSEGELRLSSQDLGYIVPDLTVPLDEGGSIDSRIVLESRAEEDQDLPSLKAGASDGMQSEIEDREGSVGEWC